MTAAVILPFIRHDLVNGPSEASRLIYFYGPVKMDYRSGFARKRWNLFGTFRITGNA
jgi:hypothetical protein